MYCHSQNVKKADKTNDIINWQFWLGDKTQLSGQIVFPTKSCALEIDLCQNGWQEDVINFHFAIPLLFNIFIGFKNNFLYRMLEKITKRKGDKYTNGRSIGISFHNNTLWIDLWDDEMEHRHDDPWWWRFNINFVDLLKGKSKCEVEVLKEKEVEIYMPEKMYKGKATVERRTWTFPRWFSKNHTSTTIDVEEGVPFPGKGTCSHNCGNDALFGSSISGGNIEKAIGNFIGSVLDNRNRYPL